VRANAEYRHAWLLISASSAGAPGSLRVAIWRKLHSLGALYLQQSVCLLPDRQEVRREVRRLVERVRGQGGTARMLTISFDDPAEEAQIVAELSSARDDEYGEVLDRVPAFMTELRMERDRGRATYEEVEESEADLERFRAWLAKIDRRDYFGAARRAEAHTAVDKCVRALEAFEAEALARDDQPPGSLRPELRVVDEGT
jgi:hypothetical protein